MINLCKRCIDCGKIIIVKRKVWVYIEDKNELSGFVKQKGKLCKEHTNEYNSELESNNFNSWSFINNVNDYIG